MTIDAKVDGVWHSDHDEYSDQHDLRYLYDVDLQASPELYDLPPTQLMEAVVRSVGRVIEQDILDNAAAAEADIPERWHVRRNSESRANGRGRSTADGVKSDHALSGRVHLETDFEGRPMAALKLDAKPLSYTIAHDVARSVLHIVSGKNVSSSMRTRGDDIDITLH